MDRIQKRFDELHDRVDLVASSFRGHAILIPPGAKSYDGPMEITDADPLHGKPAIFLQWRRSVETLLEQVFGPDSSTATSFASYPTAYLSEQQIFRSLLPIFYAAKSDYEGGFLFDVRNLVHAEVFSDELEQAQHFLRQGYKSPSAVIAGVVLETTLRKLCEQSSVDLKTDKGSDKSSDTMIADLAKLNIFNKMRADQLRAWMKTRNSAAHGHPDEFNDTDVDLMIQGVRDFVANHLN